MVDIQGAVIYSNNMDANPGWTANVGWAWGTPTGSAGDPTSGHTGANVYGYNLFGGYSNGMSSTFWLTTQAINCSGYTGVHLKFYRWLGVQSSYCDHAYVAVSNNGSTWTNVWSNSTTTINETAWSLQDIDISAYADNKAAVYIRWGMGKTDSSVTYCGWNIDDVSLTGFIPPTVISITPNSGINTGAVNITDLAGTNFQAGAAVKLSKTGQLDINATEVNVVSETQITCTLNLLDAAYGTWDVVVTNPGNESNVLVDGFTVIRIIYVKPGGNDSNTGISWAQAKKTVTVGLTAAVSGDEVWVAAGTYNERITLKASVALYGGFAGTETNLSQRNWNANATILDGQQGGSVVTSPSGATAATRIDGFTIQNGTGTLLSDSLCGGGIYCYSSSPTISNNIISGNSVDFGGGIYCDSSSPTICNNIISGNIVDSGGGIYCISSSPNISSNTISGNTAASGGGIYCVFSSSPIINNNIISENTATSVNGGGGIYCTNDSSPTISNNTIRGNITSERGGGIYCTSSSNISNNTISGNNAYVGGGIYCSASYSNIRNNIISGNTASFSGGGIYCAGGYLFIRNNTISGNTATNSGGGIYCYNSSFSLTIANNIIAFNGTGIYNSADSSTFVLRSNCLFNTTSNYDGLWAGTNDIQQNPLFVNQAESDFHLSPDSNCIDAGNDTYVQSGWLDMDGQARIYGSHVDIGADEWYPPTFTITGTVELQNYNPGSAGVSVTVIVDGGAPMTKTLDAESKFTLTGMTAGAYSIYVKASHWLSKTQTVVVSADTSAAYSLKNGDVNDDDFIDNFDLGTIAENWLEQTPSLIEPYADLNGDELVNGLDFAIMGANWSLAGE
jgi:parallel beta-helix repeat protein/predicted outer membrane repeat protein